MIRKRTRHEDNMQNRESVLMYQGSEAVVMWSGSEYPDVENNGRARACIRIAHIACTRCIET
jgi:hypothetical protein